MTLNNIIVWNRVEKDPAEKNQGKKIPLLNISIPGRKALGPPLYSGGRNGPSPHREAADPKKQASIVRRRSVMCEGGVVGEEGKRRIFNVTADDPIGLRCNM